MAHTPAALEQGLNIGERSRLLLPAEVIDDEKLAAWESTGTSAANDTAHSLDDGRRRTLMLRTFVAVALCLASATLLSDANWATERVCHRNGLCGTDSTIPNSIADARPLTPEDLLKDPHVLQKTPDYVLKYAPYVYLHADEQFWPSDMAEHLLHTTPSLNYTPIEKGKLHGGPNLTNLDQLNQFEQGRHVFLTSNDDVEDRPDWLTSAHNIPADCSTNPPNPRRRRTTTAKPCKPGRSTAPAVLITINKGNGIIDAFWFFFYSYNLGNVVLGIRWGNHVGDWEHTMVRFEHGKPSVVFLSEHSFGSAYAYEAVEKIGVRPVVYSAVGTHAMYATAGPQPYILPLGLLHDDTSRGPLWDPSLNLHSYTYTPPLARGKADTLTPSTLTPNAPAGWFFFNGKWGDKAYPLSDDRQYGFVGEYHYVNGPLGPRFKNLMRRHVCQGRFEDPCVIKHWLEAVGVDGGPMPPVLVEGEGEGEDWPEEGGELMPPMVGRGGRGRGRMGEE